MYARVYRQTEGYQVRPRSMRFRNGGSMLSISQGRQAGFAGAQADEPHRLCEREREKVWHLLPPVAWGWGDRARLSVGEFSLVRKKEAHHNPENEWLLPPIVLRFFVGVSLIFCWYHSRITGKVCTLFWSPLKHPFCFVLLYSNVYFRALFTGTGVKVDTKEGKSTSLTEFISPKTVVTHVRKWSLQKICSCGAASSLDLSLRWSYCKQRLSCCCYK